MLRDIDIPHLRWHPFAEDALSFAPGRKSQILRLERLSHLCTQDLYNWHEPRQGSNKSCRDLGHEIGIGSSWLWDLELVPEVQVYDEIDTIDLASALDQQELMAKVLEA